MARLNVIYLLATLSYISSAFAHFTLTYPESRGFDEDTESTAPCGGNFNTVGNRTQFPLTDGFIEIYSGHTSYSYTVNVIVDNDLSGNYSTNDLVQVASGSRDYPENACLSVDLSKNAAVKDGVNGTIQITFNGGDGILYQCTDVTFETSVAGWNNSVCANADSSSTSAATTSTAASASTTAATSKASTLTTTCGLMLTVALLSTLLL